VALQIMFCARQQASLFSFIDAFRAASVVGTTAEAHLDKGDCVPVAHYQVDFTVPATIVSSDQQEAVVE